MYEINDPSGKRMFIPETPSEDPPYFHPDSLESAVQYYKDNGYVVIRNVVEHELLDQINNAFDEEILKYDGYFYRQTGGNPEKNKYNKDGQLINPILNIHDLLTKKTKKFRDSGLKILTDDFVKKFSTVLFGEDPIMVQSMYFHGNTETWAHQDSYYLDSENFGSMFAIWVAAEDILPGAGRFFIYPKSHKLGLMKNTGHLSVSNNHNEYKNAIIRWMDDNKLECKAPALNKGDILIWNGNTVHGSLKTTMSGSSRRSLTAHYIKRGDKFIQFHSREIKLNLSKFNDMEIHSPKTLNSLKRKVILAVEITFPKTFQWLKWRAVKFFTK